MRSRRTTFASWTAVLAILIGCWLFLGPTKMGGSATYSITDGISMQPLLFKNDLAVIRPESNYRVGDVVLYESQVLHRPVLHRILLIQNGNYFFKGDNNDFVDPGYATQSELIGKLWFHVPWVGGALGWFGKPLHAGILAAFAALALVFAGFSPEPSQRRRNRRGRRQSPTPPRSLELAVLRRHASTRASEFSSRERRSDRTTPDTRSPLQERRSGMAMTPQQVAARRPPPYFDGPALSLVTLGVLSLVAIVSLTLGFSRPLQRVAPLANAFQQTGTFAYSAAVEKPTAVYPSGFVTTGQPIYPSLVKTVQLRFQYHFNSTLPHHIKGSIALRALLLSRANTWQQLSTIKQATSFTGDRAVLVASLPLNSLYGLVNSVSSQSGVAGLDYSADLQPVIHITGTVGSKPIHETFSPVLPFDVAPTVITLDVAVAPAPPGATYVAPSASSQLSAAVHPSQPGTIPQIVPNVISIAKYEIELPTLRLVGYIIGSLALIVAIAHDIIRRRRTLRSVEEIIARRRHVMIVPIASLATVSDSTELEVTDFRHLAELAQLLARPLLYETSNDVRTFAVDDDARRFVYRSTQVFGNTPSSPPRALPREGRERRPTGRSSQRHRIPRDAIVRASLPALLIAIIITLSVGFTASTNVPVSHAGASAQARSIAELAPPGCSALTLTTLVQGSGTFSNNHSGALVIGSAGVDKITDTGGGSCIVGGGGKDTITGTSSDTCIIGPTGGATYKTCTTSS
jgi:signal peptidase I